MTPLTGGSETEPPEIPPDGPGPLGKGLVWSLYAVSVPPHWTWTLDRSAPGYPHPVGSYCSAIQDQSGTRGRRSSSLPLFVFLVCNWGDYSCNLVRNKTEIVLVRRVTVRFWSRLVNNQVPD